MGHLTPPAAWAQTGKLRKPLVSNLRIEINSPVLRLSRPVLRDPGRRAYNPGTDLPILLQSARSASGRVRAAF
jgi:hypothetical protein